MTQRRALVLLSPCLPGLLFAGQVLAQHGRHDLMTYTAPPAGWKKDTGTGYVQYTRIDGASWAQLAVYTHAGGTGNITADFDREWQSLVADAFNLRQPPEKGTPGTTDGWSVLSGSGTWQSNGSNVATLLTTYSGHGVRMSILCNVTAKPYLEDCQRLVASAMPQVPAVASAELRSNATPAAANGSTTRDLDGEYRCLVLGFVRDLYTGVVSPHWEDKAKPTRFTLSGNRYSTQQGGGSASRNGNLLTFNGGALDGRQASIDRNDAGPFVLFRGDSPRVARTGSVGYDDTHCQRSKAP